MSPSHVFAALGIVSMIALAADDGEPVRKPYVEPGDCWSYRADNMNYNGPIEDYELCVTFVDVVKDVILAVATVKSDGREIEVSYSSEWAPRTSVAGIIYPEGQRQLKFPLRVGDTYSSVNEFRRALKGQIAGKATWSWKVVGWEEITVPAGKFRALKVEGQGAIQRYDVRREFSATTTVWYAPEVNRYVKYSFEAPRDHFSEELTGYRLRK